ncbi:telomere repeat-binding protein 5 isoform X2 [Populus trichocarpa]|uniref:telomere repeat-binding protein 5 isoform X2 n=1 Tax=Populus trichocarpa TaxID=3694 RepID=UPI000D18992D|nr:telomere repeat-binding protein 5 isoform X2 [Populus trichocarpa]|eukprot:XP_024443392.1 telomere repeat-binding protein 5 isoform X2 [Populus trichocarpa]
MVLQKRLDYGFNGYQVPHMPRATRSARRRRSFKKKHEENQMCAFDLLAIVAGKLLLDKESAPSSSNTSADKDQCAVVNSAVKYEWQDEEKPLKVEACDQGSAARNFFVSDLSQVHGQGRSNAEKLRNDKSKNDIGTFASKVEGVSSEYREFGDCKLEVETKRAVKDEPGKSGVVLSSTAANMCSLEDPVVLDAKPPALASLDSCAKVPLCRNHIPNSSYPTNQDDVNVVSRDDDDNSSGCTHPITKKKFFRPAPRIGDRRIRKILASKYWKVAPKFKDATVSNSDGDLKPVFHKRKNYYRQQRSERLYPFKKRKHYAYSSPSNLDGGLSCEFVSDSPRKGSNGDASGSCTRMHGVTGASSSFVAQHTSFQPRDSHGMRTFNGGASSSFVGQRTSFQPRDCHVKLRIKSFRVPELLVEIPESSTVGLLRRTVMEAVTAILGGGLRVGVLLQGKKVRDDNKTLLQTGISHNNQLDSLGFCLEPNPSQTPPSLCPEDSPFLLQCDTPDPISRCPPTAGVVCQGICTGSPEPHANNLGNCIESDHDSASSPTDTSMDKSTNSKALVAVPAMKVEALAVVPAHQKSKQSEIVQRRIRRPFSVAEVEALVQAVEKLGTGRWRDVKLRAFDNAKHRTYVDLKDKWKTLVHTARISPQQRRGEPVPQELLDRVLTAHAYWSQQQADQQFKHQHAETCLLL